MTLGERLREARGGRSLRLAAHDLGVDPMTLKAWEGGFKAPRPDKAQILAAYIGITKAEVLGLLGILDQEEVEALLVTAGKPRTPTTPRARRKAAQRATADGSATLSELEGAFLSGPFFGRELARVA